MERHDRRLRAGLFLSLLLLDAFIHFFLAARDRLPQGHDTGAAFAAFHHVLSSAACDEIPLWIPHAAHGVPSHGATAAHGGIVTTSLLGVAPLFRNANLLVLFHLSSWIEELLLLAGIWCLASRFLRSPWAVFFAAASAVGTTLGIEQVWFAVRSVCAVPLALHLVLGFLESGERWRGCLASALCAVASPMAPLLPLVTTAIGAAVIPAVFTLQRTRLRPGRFDAAWIAAAGLPWILTACAASQIPELVIAPRALPWAPVRLLDIGVGLLPDRDVVLFAGLVPLALAPAAFLLEPRTLGRAALAAGSMIVAAAVLPPYDADWLVKSSPFIRLSLGLAAARALDRLITGRHGGAATTVPALALGVLAVTLAVISSDLAVGGVAGRAWVEHLSTGVPGHRIAGAVRDPMIVSDLLGMTAAASACTGLLLLLPAISRRAAPLAVAGLLLFHPVDVFAWKLRSTWLRAMPLDASQRVQVRSRPLRWIDTRIPDVTGAPSFVLLKAAEHAPGSGRGWTPEPFFDADPAAVLVPSPHWTLPVGALGRAAGGPSPAGPFPRGPRPSGLDRAIGAAAPKLCLHSQAIAMDDRRALALFASPEFSASPLIVAEGTPAEGDGRTDAAPGTVDVLSFGANHLRVRVRTDRGTWLSYADAWDEGWVATVDGAPSPVVRANVAYKAVRLEAGDHTVEFRYRAPVRSLALALQPWVALTALAAALTLVSRLLRGALP